jgi:ACS family glucarate transporter-like MFS transporter
LSPATCCRAYVGYVFVFWFYLYLVQVRHFNLLRAAWLTTLSWVCTLIGIPVGGVPSDWAVNRWGATWGRRAVPLPAFLAASGLLVIGARADSARLAVTSLTLSTVLVLVTEGPFWASGGRSLPREVEEQVQRCDRVLVEFFIP